MSVLLGAPHLLGGAPGAGDFPWRTLGICKAGRWGVNSDGLEKLFQP